MCNRQLPQLIPFHPQSYPQVLWITGLPNFTRENGLQHIKRRHKRQSEI